MQLSHAERALVRKENPDCYFTRVVGFGVSVVVAIPKVPPKALQSGTLFDCPEIFHGATIHLTSHLKQI